MLFLSIHPQFVERIFDGSKRVELRRRVPRCQVGDWIAVYATTPRKALVGAMQVQELRIETPARLWRSVAEISGVSRNQYDRYFAGTDRAIGILIGRTVPFLKPVPLDQLRRLWPGFSPPQGFLYLSDQQSQVVFEQLGDADEHRAAA